MSESSFKSEHEKINKPRYTPDPTWRTLYKIGGVALLIEGVEYLMITAMGPMMGVSPGNTLAWLDVLSSHPQLAIFNYGVVTGIADFMLIPAAFALYFALKDVSKSWMIVAAGIILVYVVIDVATFVSASIDLTWLTQNYAAATDATSRAAILGAEYALLSTIPLSQFLGWSFPPFAFVIISFAIRQGRHWKLVWILGLLTAAFSLAGGVSFLDPIPYWQKFQLPALAIYSIFMLALGAMLLKFSRK